MTTTEPSHYQIAISRYQLTRKLPPGDPVWKYFNASFINLEIELPAIMRFIYDGRAITTQHSHSWRTSANYLCGQHLGLDFDNGDIHSTIPQLCKDKFIQKYAAFIYTTMSHTPEHPRARVIFLLDIPIMQAKNYTLAAAALLWLFGTADRQCKDAVRFFYGAPGCLMEQLNNMLPLAVVKKLIANYQDSGQYEKRKAAKANYVTTPDQRAVADALRLIPAWGIDYDEWVQILMGLQAGFGDAGLPLAEAWGDGLPGEVARKWTSFHADGNTTGAITLATVFRIAKRFGWRRVENKTRS